MLEQIRLKNESKTAKEESVSKISNDLQSTKISDVPEHELWTAKYKPQKFYELLTDELTNRNILTWFNSWKKHE